MTELAAIESKFRRLAELRTTRDEDKIKAEKSEEEFKEYESELYDEIDESALEGGLRFNFGPPLGVISFSLRATNFGRIIDADAATKYFEEQQEIDEMSKPKLSKSKINELVRELIDQGKPMPPGIDFTTNRGITISRKGQESDS